MNRRSNEKAAKKKSERKEKPAESAVKRKVEETPKAIIEAQTESYRALDRTLNNLIVALKKDRAAMIHQRNTHEEVVRIVAGLSEGTPLSEPVTNMKASLQTVSTKLAKQSKASENMYDEKVIDYVVEWEKTLHTKFESELKDLNEARQTLGHYEKKLGQLQNNKAKMETKAKELPRKQVDKLQRNTEKLEQAKHDYEKHRSNLGFLTEELVKKSWTDLYPLLVKLLEFNTSASQDRAIVLAECLDILESLNSVAESHGLSTEENLVTTVVLRQKSVTSDFPSTPGAEKALDSLPKKAVTPESPEKLCAEDEATPEDDTSLADESSDGEHQNLKTSKPVPAEC